MIFSELSIDFEVVNAAAVAVVVVAIVVVAIVVVVVVVVAVVGVFGVSVPKQCPAVIGTYTWWVLRSSRLSCCCFRCKDSSDRLEIYSRRS